MTNQPENPQSQARNSASVFPLMAVTEKTLHMPLKHPLADALALVAGLTSLASWQEQLDWGLRIIAAFVAILAGSVALYQRLKKREKPPLD